jgi:hypothetical protein
MVRKKLYLERIGQQKLKNKWRVNMKEEEVRKIRVYGMWRLFSKK